MPPYRVDWTGPAKVQFDDLHRRATIAGRYDEFRDAHRERMADLTLEPERVGCHCYQTKAQPPGEVRFFVRGFLAITFVLWQAQQLVVILVYASVPESWPVGEPE